ncbi:MAG: TetR/AcrR family transcriptional regulator, partial [Bacteroidota bacterium]
MPLQTFYRLTPKRQKEILDVAFSEFAQYDYQSASVSQIVKNVGMSKGGFYRYFKNKLDLYAFLIDYATKLRLGSLQGMVQETGSLHEFLV